MCHDVEYMAKDKSNAEFWTLVSACKGKRYEDDSEQWDKLLKLLGLPLRLQPLVSAAIAEGRYAQADNPQAYIATVARNKAKAKDVNLLKENGDNRGGNELEIGPISKLGWVVKQKQCGGGPRAIKASSHDEFIELAGFHYSEAYVEDIGPIGLVPRWLLIDGEDARILEDLGFGEMVDWEKLAHFAVSKAAMAEIVGFVLVHRFRCGETRSSLTASSSSAFGKAQIEAAWRWIDRNWDAKILPLFRMDKPPEVLQVARKGGPFVSPFDALRATIERQTAMQKQLCWY
jgi:hypothetical protein